MENEELLPLGEPTLEFPKPAEPGMPSVQKPTIPAYVPPVRQIPPATPSYIPPIRKIPAYVPPNLPGVPSPKQQQWGVVISIVIIVLMIIIGAFYAWGQRIAQNQVPAAIAQ